MKDKLSRCTVLAGVALSVAAASAQAAAVPSVVKANDEAFQSILARQVTDPDSRWTWAMPVRWVIHNPGSASGVLERGMATFLHTVSKFHKSDLVSGRMKLAVNHLRDARTPHGNIDDLVTNFNSLRDGGTLDGCVPAPGVEDSCILTERQATNRIGADVIRFGPGRRESDYTQARGSRPKLPGPSVYLTAYTPFDHTLTFDWC